MIKKIQCDEIGQRVFPHRVTKLLCMVNEKIGLAIFKRANLGMRN